MQVENSDLASSFLLKENKSVFMPACLLIGVMILLTSLYLLAKEAYFVHKAVVLDATIVEVRSLNVPNGQGATMAYVPVVAFPDASKPIAVETSTEQQIYFVGSTMNVVCDVAGGRCLRNTFLAKWGGSVVGFLLALLFIIPSVAYLTRSKRAPVE